MPSRFFILYDLETGNILTRLNVGSDLQASYTHNLRNALEVTNEEYTAQPELFKKVDLQTKKLVDK